MSILWNFDKYAKIEELSFDPAYISSSYLTAVSANELLLKAGTPLVERFGVVAPLGEDDGPTCFAAEDYHFILTNAQQPKLVKCVTKGYIEKAKVLEAMGVEEDPTADWAESLAALGLYLVDELGNLPGGSGGGGSGGSRTLWYGVYDGTDGTVYKDSECTQIPTTQEVYDAYIGGLFITETQYNNFVYTPVGYRETKGGVAVLQCVYQNTDFVEAVIYTNDDADPGQL